MVVLLPLLVVLASLARVAQGILADGLLLDEADDGAGGVGGARCARRLQRELDLMRRVPGQAGRRSGHQATIDLAGYALHQPLRSAPYDMYVTGMRVRVPGQTGWVRVERCQFDPRNQSLDTRLLFRDLTVTGRVKLYEDAVRPAGTCSMTLRLRRAGLGFTAAPAEPSPAVAASVHAPALPLPLHLPLHLPLGLSWGVAASHRRQDAAGGGRRDAPGPLEVRTNARFVDPDFVSVYAHGCPTPGIEHRSDDGPADDEEPNQDLAQDAVEQGRGRGRADAGSVRLGDEDERDLSREMEDVFLRGIRTLLARYMERKLQPALRDAVMAGMGYSVSYGR